MIFHRYVFKKIETNVKLKDSEGGPLKFAWKMKTLGGGSRKSSKVIRGDHFSEVTFKGGSAKFHLV